MPSLNEARDHVKVGDIYLSPRGTPDGILVDMGEWFFKADDSVANAMLKEMEVAVEREGWSSWEHEHWKIEGDEIVIDMTIGSATPDPKRLVKRMPLTIMRDAILQLKCPYKAGEKGEVILKQCEYCVYGMPWYDHKCIQGFADWLAGPVVRAVKASKAAVTTSTYNGWDYGEIGASMRFKVADPEACIPSRWECLKLGLRSTHGEAQEKEGLLFFTKHYAYTSGKEHVIVLDPKDFTGRIESRESSELSGAEDWLNLKMYVQDKVVHVLSAFAEVCWWAHGSVEAILLDKPI